MNRLRLGIITAGFLGCAPVAPGTLTLAGVLFAWLLRTTLYPAFVSASRPCSMRLAAPCATTAGPGRFVLDEVIGYLITVCWLDAPSLVALAVGFLLFRLFDILKPWPVRAMERIPGRTASCSTTSWRACTGSAAWPRCASSFPARASGSTTGPECRGAAPERAPAG